MGQIVGLKAKPKRCNLNALGSIPTPAAGEYILVSYDNSMTANGQGNFDRYIIGDGRTAATALELKYLDDSTRPYIVEEVNKAVADIQPIEITGDVTNAPDEEDLTSENQGGTDVLKFKDKAYNSALYSGLGRVYLRKNIVTLEGTGKNVLTQAMVNTANTIYHIQYDYDLNGQTITLPAGCVLEFDGGSLANGNIVGDFSVVGDNVAQMGVFPNGYNISSADKMLVAENIGLIPNDATKSAYNASIFDAVVLKQKGVILNDTYYINSLTEPIDYALKVRGGCINVQDNAFLSLSAGASLHFENVAFHGIQDLANSIRCNIARNEAFSLLLDKIEFVGCSFDAIAPVYIKSVDNDYSLTQIGVKNFIVKNCNIKNTHRNIFTLHDVVFSESFVATGNIVKDLCGVCFDLTKTNWFTDNTNYQADVVVENNIFTGFASDYDSYITPLLAETNRVFYRGNIVKNILGCHYNAYPYDAYVSSREYYCEGNIFQNIGKIVPDNETISNMAYPEIFKSKGGGGVRVAKNNSWDNDFSAIRAMAASAGVTVTDARFAECNRIDIFKPTSQLDSLFFSENKVTITNGRLGYPTSRIMAYELQINDNMFVVDGAEGTAFVVVADNSTLINILRNYIYAKSNIFHVVKEVANSSTAQVVVKNNVIYPYMPTNLCVDFQKFICEENICLGFPSAVSQGTLNLYKQKSDSVVESYLSANDVNIRSVDNTKHRIFFNKTSGSISFYVKTNCFIECQSDKGDFKLRIVNDAMYDEWGNQIALTSSYYGFLNDVSIRKTNSLDYAISISNAPKGIITFSDLKYYGGELQRTNRNYGEYEFDIDNTRPKWWCRGKYVNALGNDASAATSGASTSRPSSSLITSGFQYYDTTIGKPIWWNGSSWVDATGATV